MLGYTAMTKKLRRLFPEYPPATIVLSPEDLQEFDLRRVTLNNAKFQSLMVEEAWALWIKNLRTKYKLPERFEIDPNTGKVTAKD